MSPMLVGQCTHLAQLCGVDSLCAAMRGVSPRCASCAQMKHLSLRHCAGPARRWQPSRCAESTAPGSAATQRRSHLSLSRCVRQRPQAPALHGSKDTSAPPALDMHRHQGYQRSITQHHGWLNQWPGALACSVPCTAGRKRTCRGAQLVQTHQRVLDIASADVQCACWVPELSYGSIELADVLVPNTGERGCIQTELYERIATSSGLCNRAAACCLR